jgi:hypothetical protein
MNIEDILRVIPENSLSPQNDQLMPGCRIICFKPAPRLEWRDRNGQEEAE